jgi:hypothetical protein
MSYQSVATAKPAARKDASVIARFADRIGMVALLVMGLAMGGVTAFTGL